MPSNRISFLTLALLAAAACADSTSPVKPASMKLLAGDAQVGTVGEALANAPSFAVYDTSGNPLSGVKFRMVVVDAAAPSDAMLHVRVAPLPPVISKVCPTTADKRAKSSLATVTMSPLVP